LILEQTEETMFRGSLNLTVDDWLTIALLEDQESSDFVRDKLQVFLNKEIFTTCYMAEGSSSGKVCLTLTSDFSSDMGISASELAEAWTIGCAVSVDGVDCTSCSIDANIECIVADCTNIAGDSSSTIDTCNENRASFPGVFGPIYDLLAEDDPTYTLGRCDDDGSSSMPPPPPTSPNAAPVATPVAATGPVSSPASSPVSLPMSLPGSGPVSAPASAPEPVPVSSTVTSPNTAPVLSPQPPIVPAAADSGATGGGRSVLTLVLVSAVAAIMIP
jgi:hypothetical protein